MEISGIAPLSLCDFPGYIAYVVFTQGCNLNCSYCHNKHLIPSVSGSLDQHTVLADISNKANRLTAVVVTGGEPLLQTDLPEFLRQLPPTLKVKLDTNGTSPQMLLPLLEQQLVDFVAVDVKAPWQHYAKLTQATPADVQAIKITIRMLHDLKFPHLLRTTKVPGLCSETEWEELAASLPRTSTHIWQAYRPPEQQGPVDDHRLHSS